MRDAQNGDSIYAIDAELYWKEGKFRQEMWPVARLSDKGILMPYYT